MRDSLVNDGTTFNLPEKLLSGVSVITAVGPNTTQEQLYRCIESVALQIADFPFEHVLVFDGDKALANAQPVLLDVSSTIYAHGNKITPVAIPWTGPGAAKTAGLEAHRYKYVAFLDSDDELYPDALKALQDAATQTDAPIVQGVVKLENGSTLLDPYDIAKYGKPAPKIKSRREIFERCQVFKRANVAGKLFDSSRVKFRYNLETDMCDDVYHVVQAMFEADYVTVIPTPIYMIHGNPHSVSKSDSYTKLLAIRQYAAWAQKFAKDNMLPLPDKYYRIGCHDFTLFGKRFLRIDKWEYRTRIYLFGKCIWEHNIGL